MHPYWIQKIEEARKESVTKFWVTIFIVIVVPILLVMKEDGYIILGIACFAAAGLRFYWTGKMEAAETQRRKEDEDRKKASLEPQMQQGMSPAFATAQWQAKRPRTQYRAKTLPTAARPEPWPTPPSPPTRS